MTFLLIFFLGISIGSFLNVLIDRLPLGKNPLLGRSHCDFCKKTLRWYDLIPLLSFILLHGRCRYCHKKLSYQYPFVELLAGFLFVAFSVESIVGGHASLVGIFYNWFLISVLIAIFFTDLKYGIIPDKIVFPSVLITTFYLIFFQSAAIYQNVLSAVGASLFFLVIIFATKGRGMGLGDLKFAFFLGLTFGFPLIALVLYLAFLTGGAIGSILVLWGKKSLKSAIPFGPLLSLSGLMVIFFGEKLLGFLEHILGLI